MNRIPVLLMLIGLALMLAGVFLLMLLVMGTITNSYFMSFFSYGLSLVGFILGLAGVLRFYQDRKRREQI